MVQFLKMNGFPSVHLWCILVYPPDQELLPYRGYVKVELSICWANDKLCFPGSVNNRNSSRNNCISWDPTSRQGSRVWLFLCVSFPQTTKISRDGVIASQIISPKPFLNQSRQWQRLAGEGLVSAPEGKNDTALKTQMSLWMWKFTRPREPWNIFRNWAQRNNGRLCSGLAWEPVWHKLHCKQLRHFKHLHLHTWH